jgi:hypothetical protein
VNAAIGERRCNFGWPCSTYPQNWRVGWPHWPTGKMVDGGDQYKHLPERGNKSYIQETTLGRYRSNFRAYATVC